LSSDRRLYEEVDGREDLGILQDKRLEVFFNGLNFMNNEKEEK